MVTKSLVLNNSVFNQSQTSSPTVDMVFSASQDLTLRSIRFKAESNYFRTIDGESLRQSVDANLYINNVLAASVSVRELSDNYIFYIQHKVKGGEKCSITIRCDTASRLFVYRGTSTENYNAGGLAFTATRFFYSTINYEYEPVWEIQDYPKLIYMPYLSPVDELGEPKPYGVWQLDENINLGYPFVFWPEEDKTRLYICENGLLNPVGVYMNKQRYSIFATEDIGV